MSGAFAITCLRSLSDGLDAFELARLGVHERYEMKGNVGAQVNVLSVWR